MSSANSYPRCALELGSSRALVLCSSLLMLAALAAPWTAGVPALAALFSNAFAVALSPPLVRWARGPLKRLVWFPAGNWLLLDRDGNEHDADALREGVFVGARLMMLRWCCRCCDRQWRVAITTGNCDVEARRRLAVRLRATPDDRLFGRRGQFEDFADQ